MLQAINGRIDFIKNASTQTTSDFQWQGGKGFFSVEGDFSVGGTVKLQFQSPNTTWINVPNASFTANGLVDIELPACRLRVVASQTLGSSKTITGITKASPAVVSSLSHGFTNGQRVQINSVVGMTQVNGNEYIVASALTNSFALHNADGTNVDSTGYTTYVSGGTAQQVLRVEAAYVYAIGRPQ